MPRPDEHPQLVAMGMGEPTCEVCMFDLFPQAPDDICTDCELNPMQGDEASTEVFVRDAMARESQLSDEEARLRAALGSLAQQPDNES